LLDHLQGHQRILADNEISFFSSFISSAEKNVLSMDNNEAVANNGDSSVSV
jgi:hypothetical protein